MKCPDTEKLNLFIDNELSEKELLKVKGHLNVCQKCKDEVAQLTRYEEKIIESFRSFSDNSEINKSIMEKIGKEKLPGKSFSFMERALRILLPAFALCLILFVALKFNSYPGKKYPGSASLISCKAKDSDAFFNQKVIVKELEFKVQPLEVNNFVGVFDFEIVLSKTKKINWNGSGSFSISTSGDINFKEGNGIFSNNSSESVLIESGNKTYTLGGSPVELSDKEVVKEKIKKDSMPELKKSEKVIQEKALDKKNQIENPVIEDGMQKNEKKDYNSEIDVVAPTGDVMEVEKVKQMSNPFDEKPLELVGD